VAGDGNDRPGDIFHPDFRDGKPGYFDVTVRQSLQPCFLCQAAAEAGAAAAAGEQVKDAAHRDRVEAAGGDFFPLVVESLGFWSPHSRELLGVIASRAAVHSGLQSSRAASYLHQQLAVRLWQYNARMLLSRIELSGGVRGLWDLPT